MDLSKHMELFNPINISKPIHIIGVGATGGYIAQQLIKLGCTNLHIWDFDEVDDHNVTNQIYDQSDIGKPKTVALEEKLLKINPEAKIVKHAKWDNNQLVGYVFICVDSVELTYKIISVNEYNTNIEYVFNTRIGTTTGQIYAVDWHNSTQLEEYKNQSDFKDDEVEEQTSACGTTLSLSPTVLITISYAIADFINAINKQNVPFITYLDAFTYRTKIVNLQ